MAEYINLTAENIDKEHLCCAISDKKHQYGVNLKKEWLKQRIDEGHIFRKLNANGKIFIEYAPLESAWTPVKGNNFTYIYCLWVAGSYKGSGYGGELLEYAIEDSRKQGKNGVCVISSKKKKPFLSEKKFFLKYGFEPVDSIGDYELLALSFNHEVPEFCSNARSMETDSKDITIFYSLQCPYIAHSITQLQEYSEESNIKIHFEKIDSLEKAESVPCIFNNWAVFKDGKFLTNTILNKNMAKKLFG